MIIIILPDLSVCDFLLWDISKVKSVHKNLKKNNEIF